jgi:hypothetical protein
MLEPFPAHDKDDSARQKDAVRAANLRQRESVSRPLARVDAFSGQNPCLAAMWNGVSEPTKEVGAVNCSKAPPRRPWARARSVSSP